MDDDKAPVEETASGEERDDEQRQSPLIHEGAPADPASDSNERADEKATIVEPDGSPSPRAD